MSPLIKLLAQTEKKIESSFSEFKQQAVQQEIMTHQRKTPKQDQIFMAFQQTINRSDKAGEFYIGQTKKLIYQCFRGENGLLCIPRPRFYSLHELVIMLIKRCKILYDLLQNSRIWDLNKFEEYLQVQLYQKNKKEYENFLQAIKVEDEINSSLHRKLQSLEEYKKQAQISLQKLRRELELLKKPNAKVPFMINPEQRHIYLGEILLQQPDYRQYFVDVLERFMGQVVKSSKLLYRMDLQNPTNFHKYIDNRPNVALIALLKNGYTVAAFSEEAFSDKMQLNKRGLIFSLTNRKAFKSYKRAACFDRSHIIFGNSEIRILNGKNKIFSNIGISNGYYENTDSQVNIIIGQGKERQAEMQTYQVLEIIFK